MAGGMKGDWSNGGAKQTYAFFTPSDVRKNPMDIPKGWAFEFRTGVNEYQRMQGQTLLRIKELGIQAERGYCVYRGNKYVGTFHSLAEAVKAAGDEIRDILPHLAHNAIT